MAQRRRSRGRPDQRRTLVRDLALGAGGLILVILVWQLATSLHWVSPRSMPQPLDVATALVRLLGDGAFWAACGSTIFSSLVGIGICIVIAVPLSMAIHANEFVRESTWFVIEFLKPVPGVAIIPLALLLWGPTETVKLFLIVFGALWPLLTQFNYGLREVPGTAIEMSRVYRFTGAQRSGRIVIPSLMPFAFTGLRITTTLALIIAIVAEYIIGVPGIGALLALAQTNGVLDRMYAVMVVAGLLGLLFAWGVSALSRPLLFWHASERERVGR